MSESSNKIARLISEIPAFDQFVYKSIGKIGDPAREGAGLVASTYRDVAYSDTAMQAYEGFSRYLYGEIAKIPFLGTAAVKINEISFCSELGETLGGPPAKAACRAARDVLTR